MSDVSDQQITSTVRALLSQDYSFEIFLKDRLDGAKERIRQQIKNKKRYDAKKALKEKAKQTQAESPAILPSTLPC